MNSSNPTFRLESTVRQVLAETGRLGALAGQLTPDADLAEAGLTSLACVDVMLALEGEFGEFPERMLSASMFRSIASITAGLAELHPD